MVLRSRRSSILASNIANADTPNYKARDIDFKAVMQSMQKPGSGGQLQLAGTHRNHLPVSGSKTDSNIQFRNPLHASLDGNTVDSHVEQARFAENALQYQASFSFLDSRIKGLIGAIRGE